MLAPGLNLLSLMFVEGADYGTGIPFGACCYAGEHGVLRLCLAVRFALRQTLLRMTGICGVARIRDGAFTGAYLLRLSLRSSQERGLSLSLAD